MYRFRKRSEVLYGHMGDYLETCEQLNRVIRDHGWHGYTFWVPTIGVTNEIWWEADYPDLATWQTEGEAFESDPEAMRLYRSLAPLVVQGGSRDELFESALDAADAS